MKDYKLSVIFAIILTFLFIGQEILSQPYFKKKTNSIADLSYGSMDVGDIDNDGDYDLVITGFQNKVRYTKIYKLSNDSVFTETFNSMEQVGLSSSVFGDYDRDGDLDLLLVGENNSSAKVARIYKNDGKGMFTDIAANLAGASSGKGMWVDFDRDGDLDVLITGEDAFAKYNTKFFRNDAGVFTEVSTTLPGIIGGDVEVLDYNQDGWLDVLITGNDGKGRISKIFSFISGKWVDNNVNVAPLDRSAAAWCDYNSDGWQDLFITGYNGKSSEAALYINNNGKLSRSNISFTGLKNGSVQWGAHNNWNTPDLIYTGETDDGTKKTLLYKNNITTFDIEVLETLVNLSSGPLKWGDFNKDGLLDLVISGLNSLGASETELYYHQMVTPITGFVYPDIFDYKQEGNKITLFWNNYVNVYSYNVMVGTKSGSIDLVSPMADLTTAFRKIQEPGNAGTDTFFILNDLPTGNYFWNIQPVRTNYQGFSFLGEHKFRVLGTSIPVSDFGSPLCEGSSVIVPFVVSDTFLVDNSFILQLSDKNGSFAAPFNLDTIFTNHSDTFKIVIPAYVPVGEKYRFRVISKVPYTIGKNNGRNISIIKKTPIQLVYPSNNDPRFIFGGEIKWVPISDALNYVIEICKDNDFAVLIDQATINPDIFTYKPSNLVLGQKYFWRMKPVYKCGEGLWSETRNFTVLNFFMGVVSNNLNAGDELSIKINVSAQMEAENVFAAELSDAAGSFDNPTVIGKISSDTSVLINIKIPTLIKTGNKYRIRVRSSNPAAFTPDNGRDIYIEGIAAYDITIKNAPEIICAGEELEIQYIVSDQFMAGNVFTAQLSGPLGFFNSPVNIGSATRNGAGVIKVVIPKNTIGSKRYRMRIVATSPLKNGADNGFDIEISPLAPVQVTGSNRAEAGVEETYTTTKEDSVSIKWVVTGGELLSADNIPNIKIKWSPNYKTGIIKLIKINNFTQCADSSLNFISVYRSYKVSGTVKDALLGDGIGGARVDFIGQLAHETVFTNTQGVYNVNLPDDKKYIARAYVPLDKNYIPQYFDGVTNITESTPIILSGDQPNINFQLSQKIVAQNRIFGSVTNDLGDKIPAYVVLLYITKQGQGGLYDAITYDAVESEGTFEFTSVPSGYYVILAVPDPEDYAPGYYKSNSIAVKSWLGATKIQVESATQSGAHRVQVKKLPLEVIAKGKISGDVFIYTGSVGGGKGDVPMAKKQVSGAMTFTVDENDKVRKYDFSDNKGGYTMQNLENGDYTIVADKVGYEMYEKTITISDINPEISLEIPLNSYIDAVFDKFEGVLIAGIFPNPNNGSFSINTPDGNYSEMEFDVLDLTGKQIISGKVIPGDNSKVNLEGITSGSYYLRLKSGLKYYYTLFRVIE